MALFLTQVVNALTTSSIYLLVAMGISLVYGLARYVNFAQGELVTLGAFLSWELTRAGLPVVVAILCAGVAVALLSEVLEYGLFRRTIRHPLNGFVVSLGLITALEGAFAAIFPNSDYQLPQIDSAVANVSHVIIAWNSVVLICTTVVATVLVELFLRKTRTGRYARAISEDRPASLVLGVPVTRVTAVIFMVGSGLAGLAGGLFGTSIPFNAYSGSTFLLQGFAVAIVGGLGNIRGAVIASLLLGCADTFGSAYVSLAWGPDMGLAAIIVMLLIFPTGFLRGTETGEALGAEESAIALSGAGQRSASLWKVLRVRAQRARSGAEEGRKLGAAGLEKSRAATAMGWSAVAALVMVIPLIVSSGQFMSNCSYAGVVAIAGYSAWFLFRNAGIPSIAQAAFMGIGAYTTAIASQRLGVGFWGEIGLALVIGLVVAGMIGAICLRTRGSYFLIIVFAFVGITGDVLTNWSSLTGGADGMIVTSSPRPLGGLVSFAGVNAMYWLIMALLGLVVIVVHLLDRSTFGQRLIAARDNELLAESLGLHAYLYKVAAFAICGGIASIAGTLYLYQQLSIQPSSFGIFPGVDIFLAVLLGGVGVLGGPIIGTAVLILLPDLLGLGPQATQIADGVILVGIILFLPLGVGGSIRQAYQRVVSSFGGDATAARSNGAGINSQALESEKV